MFKRVLLCHDGSTAGRRALRRGAELAILLNARVFVLSIVSSVDSDATLVANAVGHASFIDSDFEHRKSLNESIALLKERGVQAEGYLARGNTIDAIAEYAKRLGVDLIVVGHYPKASGGRWWSGPERTALAERVNCSVLIATGESDAPLAR